ncbi:uncharacterized protein LOC120661476 isoform X2 [Panicum virgatum]|uniref:uncharacterized protein LOC120661476 isoform X2 n=1 Tax=Panicum virgatum TaxID=38727 RepID=UPI0019D5B510|nr:uncharacterized protein LOC120661476 isoform X2 [Panicum virgatum]
MLNGCVKVCRKRIFGCPSRNPPSFVRRRKRCWSSESRRRSPFLFFLWSGSHGVEREQHGGGRDAEQLGAGEAAALLNLHPAAPPGPSPEAIRHVGWRNMMDAVSILELHRKRNTFFVQKLPALQEHGAAQLVLQAHKEAVNSLGENGPAKLGTVATVVAVANATAIEATKEVEAAMKISLRAALGSTTNKLTKGQLDDLTIMMETLRVKDDELHQLLQDIRARDSTINEIADKLQETAEAAETAASAARSIDEERRFLSSELERLKQDHEKQVEVYLLRLRESEEKGKLLVEERDHLLTERDSALQEAQMWRSELGKARGNAVILEAAVVRAEEKARVSAADADLRIKEAVSRLESAIKEKEDLLALVDALQSQLKRQETSTIQVCEESSELCSTTSNHVEDDNVDKACVSDTDPIPVAENIVELDDEGVDIRTIGDTEWSNPHSSEVSDVREVTTDPEENSLDIPVDT